MRNCLAAALACLLLTTGADRAQAAAFAINGDLSLAIAHLTPITFNDTGIATVNGSNAGGHVTELEIPSNREGLPVVLDAALLVRPGHVEELRRRFDAGVEGLGAIGMRTQLTGPWAPYRFVTTDGRG